MAEIRSFLGAVGYYRQYTNSLASVAKPLTHITKKGEKYVWDESTNTAFNYLKQKLV